MSTSYTGEKRPLETKEGTDQAAKRRKMDQTLIMPTPSETLPSAYSAASQEDAKSSSWTELVNRDDFSKALNPSKAARSTNEDEFTKFIETASAAYSLIDSDAEDEERQNYIYRCICNDLDESFPGTDICCDGCEAWQHSLCMGLTQDESTHRTEYFCEVCRPGDHALLLERVKQGDDMGKRRRDAKMRFVAATRKQSKQRVRRPSQYLRS
jgi:hypothetical protein